MAAGEHGRVFDLNQRRECTYPPPRYLSGQMMTDWSLNPVTIIRGPALGDSHSGNLTHSALRGAVFKSRAFGRSDGISREPTRAPPTLIHDIRKMCITMSVTPNPCTPNAPAGHPRAKCCNEVILAACGRLHMRHGIPQTTGAPTLHPALRSIARTS